VWSVRWEGDARSDVRIGIFQRSDADSVRRHILAIPWKCFTRPIYSTEVSDSDIRDLCSMCLARLIQLARSCRFNESDAGLPTRVDAIQNLSSSLDKYDFKKQSKM
jgi:hypothetical protein